jgi:hypothetical protein
MSEDGKNLEEDLELWRRDPERVYADKGGKERIYDEMWTADWWWDTQVSND